MTAKSVLKEEDRDRDRDQDYRRMYEDLLKRHNTVLQRYREVLKTIGNLGLDLQVFAKNSNIFTENLAAEEIPPSPSS